MASTGDPYPDVRTFGEFPNEARESLVALVRKREATLSAMRNAKNVQSADILAVLAADLQKVGFGDRPKRFDFGVKYYEVDRYNEKKGIALEVEKGRVMLGNQLYLDLFKFHVINQVKFGAIILPSISRESAEEPFRTASAVLDVLYSKPELKLQVGGILLVGF